MSINYLLKKRALYALFFFSLHSCCSNACPQWAGECTVGTGPVSNSARIYLCPSNESSGLQLELVRMACELRLYINVFGLEIPADPCDPSTSPVYISFKDHSYIFAAQRFLGGQRLLIPDHVQSEIVRYLKDDQPVYLRAGRYEADIYPNKFLNVYDRMILMPM